MNILEGLSLCEFTPKEEIDRRILRLKEEMEKSDIGISIILQNVDIFYFSGTLQKSILLIPIEGDPLLLVEKNVERAKVESPIDQIPIRNDREAKKHIERYVKKGMRCGMELDVIPVSLLRRLEEIVGGLEIADISRTIREIRAIKSEFEISQIKKSGKIVSLVFEEAKAYVREGEREIDIAARLESIGRMNGHQGILRMRGLNQEMMNIYVIHGISATIPSFGDVPISGCGVTPAVAQGPSLNRIKRGVPTLIDYGGAYNGYITDETRIFLIGEWGHDLFRKGYECAYEIITEVEGLGKDGVCATEIFEKALSIAKRHGLRQNFMGHGETKVSFIGHGLGLEINELPVITGRHRTILKEGMVFAFEPKFVFPSLGASGLEVDFIVRKWGLERVTDFPLDVVRL